MAKNGERFVMITVIVVKCHFTDIPSGEFKGLRRFNHVVYPVVDIHIR